MAMISNLPPQASTKDDRNRTRKRSHSHPESVVVKQPLAQKQKPRRARSRKPKPNVEPMVAKPPVQHHLLVGKVRILKSSETAPDCFMKKQGAPEPVLEYFSDEEAKLQEKKNKVKVGDNSNKVDYFAGFGFYTSPPPSTLPIPRFLAKKEMCCN